MFKKIINAYKNYKKAPSYIKDNGFIPVMTCFIAIQNYELGLITKEECEELLNRIGLSLNEPK